MIEFFSTCARLRRAKNRNWNGPFFPFQMDEFPRKSLIFLALNTGHQCIITFVADRRHPSLIKSRSPLNLEDMFLEIGFGFACLGFFGRCSHVCDLASRLD